MKPTAKTEWWEWPMLGLALTIMFIVYAVAVGMSWARLIPTGDKDFWDRSGWS